MGASKRGDTVVGEDEFSDDKPTRFDFRPPEALAEEELEVPMMSVDEALRAADPSLSFNDGTEEHEMRGLGPTGEGEDEFDSATVPTPEADAPPESAGLAPDGVDPRTVDPRGPTVRRAASNETQAAEPTVASPRPATPPEVRPAWRAPAIERTAPSARSFQVVNRNSVPPTMSQDLPGVRSEPLRSEPPAPRVTKSVPPPARSSKAPGPDRPSYSPSGPRASLPPAVLRLSETGDLRLQEQLEAAKRTAKVLPIAMAGGITIAFIYAAFGGGRLDEVSDEMKEEASKVYASSAALRSEDKEHAADPLIRIESEPSGARVEVNNVEIGRTPLLAPSPYSHSEYFLVILRDGQEPWHAYLQRDLRVSRRIEVMRQRYEGTSAEVQRDKNGLGFVKVTLRAAK